MAAAGLYLGFAGIGKMTTGHAPFFFLDEDVVGSKEKVAGFCTGFVTMAAASEFCDRVCDPKRRCTDSEAVFSMLYGFVSMRENVSHTH